MPYSGDCRAGDRGGPAAVSILTRQPDSLPPSGRRHYSNGLENPYGVERGRKLRNSGLIPAASENGQLRGYAECAEMAGSPAEPELGLCCRLGRFPGISVEAMQVVIYCSMAG